MEFLSISIVLLAIAIIVASHIIASAIRDGLKALQHEDVPSSSSRSSYLSLPDEITTPVADIQDEVHSDGVEDERLEIRKRAAFSGPVLRATNDGAGEMTGDFDVAEMARSIDKGQLDVQGSIKNTDER